MKENDYDYIKNCITRKDIEEELEVLVKDLNNAQFTATMNVKVGITNAFTALMTTVEGIIEVLEDNSPDPENDEHITHWYGLYDALEKIKAKTKYI